MGIKFEKSVVGTTPAVQATTELLAASTVSKSPLVILLADLNEHWKFLWLTKTKVVISTLGHLKGRYC